MRMQWLSMMGAILVLTACGDGRETDSDTGDAENQADMTPEGPSMASRLFGGGRPMPLAIQSAHPNGLVLQLNSIRAKPTETVVGVTIINGDNDEQRLNRWPNTRDSYIIAGNGDRLLLSPPQNNPELAVPPGQRFQGELVFLGRLEPGGTATLILNDGSQLSNEHTNMPGFRIELPLRDVAFSDDGSKKNGAS